MKRNLGIAAALLGALAAAGCQSEMMEPERPSGAKTLKVIAESGDTRTGIFLDESDNKYKAYWSESDRLVLFETIDSKFSLEASESEYAMDYISVNTTLVDDGAKAVFDFELTDRTLPDNEVFRYIGFYPMSMYGGGFYAGGHITAEQWEELWGESLTSTHLMLVGNIWSSQSPTSDSFDPRRDVLISKLIEADEQPEQLRFNFARIGSIAKITLKGLPAGYYVTSGTFAHGSSWQGAGYFFYDPQLERVLPAYGFMGMDEVPTIEFTPNEVRVNDDGEAVIWLRTLSGQLTDWFSFDVFVSPDGQTPSLVSYTKYVDLADQNKSINFREGGLSSFSVTLEPKPLIEFDEETTLKYFPELEGNGQRVIRIPKEYYPNYNVAGWDDVYGFPLFFDSDYSWDVSIEFPEGTSEDYGWISVNRQAAGYYLHNDSNTILPETATLVFTCTDGPDISIRIPIEGFSPIILKKDGFYVDGSSDVCMSGGQTSTFTACLDFPSWLEVVPDSFEWVVDEAEYLSYEDSHTTSLALTVGDVSEPEWFGLYFCVVCFNHLTEEEEWCSGYASVRAEPRPIPLVWNDVDWHGKSLKLTFDETVTIQADLRGISKDDIVSFEWDWEYCTYSGAEFSLVPDDPYSVKVETLSSDENATLYLNVEMADGTIYRSYCYVSVSPIVLKWRNYRLYGEPIELSPGQSFDLTASLEVDTEGHDYKMIWAIGSNRHLSLKTYSYNQNKATIYAKDEPGEDFVYVDVKENDYYLWAMEYPVLVLP